LIVNPVAGLGGAVALKGTDGAALAEARARGAVSAVPGRVARALARFVREGGVADWIAAAGAMGEDALARAGIVPARIVGTPKTETSAADTAAAAAAMAREGCALILFAGGDGTARDAFDGASASVPILGMPAGVKMHSAVFAATPEAAGELAARVALGATSFREAEIMDIDEAALRQGRISPRLHGIARAPKSRALVQGPKMGAAPSDDAELNALCRAFVAEMEPGRSYILGPGTTLGRVKAALGIASSPLAVDVVRERTLVAADADEARILAALDDGPATIAVGVVGGQGFLFGRGNQPISPRVIARVARANIVVLADQSKILGLDPPHLRVDTGDPECDRMLSGFLAVRTGPQRTLIVKVAA
jgi:predicted polyphosphate/ATP-dependent NAD kinase